LEVSHALANVILPALDSVPMYAALEILDGTQASEAQSEVSRPLELDDALQGRSAAMASTLSEVRPPKTFPLHQRTDPRYIGRQC